MISGIGNIPRMPSNPPETKEDKEIKEIEKTMKSLKLKLGGIKEDDNKQTENAKNEKELEKEINSEQSDHSDENFDKGDKQEVKRDLDDTDTAIKLYKSAKKTGDEKTMQKALSNAKVSIKKAKDGISALTKPQGKKANKSANNNKDKRSSEIQRQVFSENEEQIGKNIDELV